jgi:hypothetical protein
MGGMLVKILWRWQEGRTMMRRKGKTCGIIPRRKEYLLIAGMKEALMRD